MNNLSILLQHYRKGVNLMRNRQQDYNSVYELKILSEQLVADICTSQKVSKLLLEKLSQADDVVVGLGKSEREYISELLKRLEYELNEVVNNAKNLNHLFDRLENEIRNMQTLYGSPLNSPFKY